VPDHQTQRFPICALCNESIELKTAKTNDSGKAVHEECHVIHLRALRSPQPLFNRTPASKQSERPPVVISREAISAYLTEIGINGGRNGSKQTTITKRDVPGRRKRTKPTETRTLDYPDTMSDFEKESLAAEALLAIERQRKNLAVSCPTCGAAPGKKCELTSGAPRSQPHHDRRTIAKYNP
jgi:hypothetical protein